MAKQQICEIDPLPAARIYPRPVARSAQLHASRQLCFALERISDGVLFFDIDSRLAGANAAASAMLGLGQEELTGWSVEHLITRLGIQPRSITGEPELGISRALLGQPVRNEPYKCMVPGRSGPVCVLLSAFPMLGDYGEIAGTMVILRDVTEITRLQQRVADAEGRSEVGEFATGIIHDLNGVLHVIQQAVALLEMPPSGGPRNDATYLGLIRTSIKRGVQLLQRWREFARGGAGEMAPIDLAPLLNEVLTEALDVARPLCLREHICLRTDLNPVDRGYGNAIDLRRIFTNLILNAIQAMPHGGELHVSTAHRSGRVLVMISDTGRGISAEESKKIFQPYFTTKTNGTGLGLATARKMLQAQGGDISFQSEEGKGSCFIVELPEPSEARMSKAV